MEPAPQLVLQPGARLGPHVLIRWLGEGGFAEVWLARRADAKEAPPVAVKVVRRSRARDSRAQAMFRDEAALSARIRHPNVASVFEVGEESGLLYLLMEYVSGGSLEAVLAGAEALGEPVPVAVAVRLLADVCAGLHAAHELCVDGRPQHVIHRDVSPHNILVTEDGVPKLIDFGIAKARERLAGDTSTGVTKGKIAYMSPEQARAGELDRRSDLWSIGAVAVELLEGRPLLSGATEVARLQELVGGAVEPVFARTPARVAQVVARALSLAPEDRQPTADALRLDLERALAREGLEATSADVADYCRRARAAVSTPAPAPRLGELLGAPAAALTVSATVLAPSTPPPRRGRARWIALAALAPALLVAALLWPREGGSPPPRALSPAPSSVPPAPPPPPDAPSAEPSVAPPAPPALPTAAPRPSAVAPRPSAGPTRSLPRRHKDDDQID
jgi:serine/threonine-protein kinase